MKLVKKFLERFLVEKHQLILEEEDLIKTLQTINKYHRVPPKMTIGNCGWTDSKKWFIQFETTETKWKLIRTNLKVVRVFGNSDIPKNTSGVVYSTD